MFKRYISTKCNLHKKPRNFSTSTTVVILPSLTTSHGFPRLSLMTRGGELSLGRPWQLMYPSTSLSRRRWILHSGSWPNGLANPTKQSSRMNFTAKEKKSVRNMHTPSMDCYKNHVPRKGWFSTRNYQINRGRYKLLVPKS